MLILLACTAWDTLAARDLPAQTYPPAEARFINPVNGNDGMLCHFSSTLTFRSILSARRLNGQIGLGRFLAPEAAIIA